MAQDLHAFFKMSESNETVCFSENKKKKKYLRQKPFCGRKSVLEEDSQEAIK